MGYSDLESHNNHVSTELLSAYIDGEVTREESARVEHHIAACQSCSNELASLRWTVELLHAVPAIPVPRSFVVRPIDLEPRGTQPGLTLPSWLVTGLQWATVATAILAILVFGYDMLTPGRAPMLGATALEAPQAQPAEAPMAAERAREQVEPAGGTVATPAAQGEAQALQAPPQAESARSAALPTAPAAAAIEDRAATTTFQERLRSVEVGLLGLLVILLGAWLWARRRRARATPRR